MTKRISRSAILMIGAALSFVSTAHAQPPGETTQETVTPLTALDYFEIGQLVARYANAIVYCTNSGYDYAALFTANGWFAPSREGVVGNKWQGRERLAEAAGGGAGGCRDVARRNITHVLTNHIITAAPGGATGRVDLVAVGVGGDPFKAERQGHYEDVYVKTSSGWRFQSRTHVLLPGQTVTPLNRQRSEGDRTDDR